MAMSVGDRQSTALAVLRICLGVFFIFEALLKISWLTDSSILAGRFAGWANALPAGSISVWYIQHIAAPGVGIFSRLVPLGEAACGLALVSGFWTPLAATVAFFMALNFHVASGAIFQYSFLTNGYGLPVLGSTAALALGGVRLPWSVREMPS